LFVEKHWNTETRSHLLSDSTSQTHALVHADVLNRNKWYDIRGPDARMDTVVSAKVDQFRRLGHRSKRGLSDGIGWSGEGQHRSVVVWVHGLVQEPDSRHGSYCRNERADDGGIPAFTEIGDAFDDWRHGLTLDETTKPEGTPIPSGFIPGAR
jgi:hypothetical protein